MKAIVFDLDGTLADSVGDIAGALDHYLQLQGYAAIGATAVATMMGDGAPELVARALEVQGCSVASDRLIAMGDEFHAIYDAWPHRSSRVFDGVVDLLPELSQAYKLAICTNKNGQPADSLLSQLGIRHHFSALVGGDSAGAQKPDPRPLQMVLDQLSVTPDQAVMVGDSINDIRMAHAVGMRAIGCRYGFPRQPDDLRDADGLIDRFSDLPAMLVQLA